MTAPTTTALRLVETAVLAALNALAPAGSAWWGVAPTGTVARLSAATSPLSRAYVAQHQDGGGQPLRHLHSDGWEGLVVVRVLSADDARAWAGFDLAVAAMDTLTGPSGYVVRAAWDRPIALPTVNAIVARAGQWRVTVRRVAL